MRIAYVLLSPRFGMHQYTADLANRLDTPPDLVTTAGFPRAPYAPGVRVHTPVRATNSGFERQTLDRAAYHRLVHTVLALQPDLVHLTGPHLWNVPLLRALHRYRIPTLHTLHDLDPHYGYGRLLHLWNALILRLADVILVHGRCYHDRLLARGLPPHRLAYTPLLHLFLSHAAQAELDWEMGNGEWEMSHSPFPNPHFLFFGRLEAYKGLDTLLDAWGQLQASANGAAAATLTIAGPGTLNGAAGGGLPPNTRLVEGHIADEQAIRLFQEADLVLLPYHDATQSALIAAAYYFGKPVLVTRTGALPEYVAGGQTGYVVPPRDPRALAAALAHAHHHPDQLRAMGANGNAWYQRQRAGEWDTLRSLYTRLADAPP